MRPNAERPIVELHHALILTPDKVALSRLVASGERAVTLDIIGIFKPVTLRLVATRQTFGTRWWWECPGCGRRCRILLRAPRAQSFGCRVCLKAKYLRDYPAYEPYLVYRQLSGFQPGPFDHWQEIARLAEPRRHGVRRGRRVSARLRRLLKTAPPLGDMRGGLGRPYRVECYDRDQKPYDVNEEFAAALLSRGL